MHEQVSRAYHWMSAERVAATGATLTAVLSLLVKVPIEQIPFYIIGGAIAVGGVRFMSKDMEDVLGGTHFLGKHTRFDSVTRVGSALTLKDGTIILPGDKLLKTQIGDNYHLLVSKMENRSEKKISQLLMIDFLRALINLCEKLETNNADLKDIKAVMGVSRFASMSMAKALGFEIFELSNWYGSLLTYFDIKEVFLGVQQAKFKPKELIKEFKQRKSKMKMAIISRKEVIASKQIYIDVLTKLEQRLQPKE